MIEDLLEVWRVHDEINFYLLANIANQGFQAVTLLKTGKPAFGNTGLIRSWRKHQLTLRKKYGAGRWRKLKGIAQVRLRTGRVRTTELHWYEAHGIGKKEASA